VLRAIYIFLQRLVAAIHSVRTSNSLLLGGSRSDCTRCGYEVPVMILLEASYLYTYSFLRGVTLEVLPLSRYALSPTMLSAIVRNIFLNSCCGIVLSVVVLCFWMSSISWIFVSARTTIFRQQSEVIRSQIRGSGWMFQFSNIFLGEKQLDWEVWGLRHVLSSAAWKLGSWVRIPL